MLVSGGEVDLRTKCFSRQFSIRLLMSLWLLFSIAAIGQDVFTRGGDPHRNEIGFFDIHVCKWPDRPEFFFALFSSSRFDEISGVEIFRPDHRSLGELDIRHFRLAMPKDMPVKRVYMMQFPTEKTDTAGWYVAKITLKDGRRFEARDYVKVKSLPVASLVDIFPANGAEDVRLPEDLRWEPVAGAGFYQVFITDLWNDGQQFYTSDVLKEPRLKLPPGLLKSGGMYSWRVHARDINEDEELGDFNSGSLSLEARFTVE